jgi:hypothetical protein
LTGFDFGKPAASQRRIWHARQVRFEVKNRRPRFALIALAATRWLWREWSCGMRKFSPCSGGYWCITVRIAKDPGRREIGRTAIPRAHDSV